MSNLAYVEDDSFKAKTKTAAIVLDQTPTTTSIPFRLRSILGYHKTKAPTTSLSGQERLPSLTTMDSEPRVKRETRILPIGGRCP